MTDSTYRLKTTRPDPFSGAMRTYILSAVDVANLPVAVELKMIRHDADMMRDALNDAYGEGTWQLDPVPGTA